MSQLCCAPLNLILIRYTTCSRLCNKSRRIFLHHVRHFSKLIINCCFSLQCFHRFINGCVMSNSCPKIILFDVQRPKCSVTRFDPLSLHVTKLQVLCYMIVYSYFLHFPVTYCQYILLFLFISCSML